MSEIIFIVSTLRFKNKGGPSTYRYFYDEILRYLVHFCGIYLLGKLFHLAVLSTT